MQEERERLRGEGGQIKFIYLRFKRWQVVGFRKARRGQKDVPWIGKLFKALTEGHEKRLVVRMPISRNERVPVSVPWSLNAALIPHQSPCSWLVQVRDTPSPIVSYYAASCWITRPDWPTGLVQCESLDSASHMLLIDIVGHLKSKKLFSFLTKIYSEVCI